MFRKEKINITVFMHHISEEDFGCESKCV